MSIAEILASVDREIAALQQARALLSGSAVAGRRPVGRPKKSDLPVAKAGAAKKRNLSPEGRKRIVEAVKRRWASQQKKSGK